MLKNSQIIDFKYSNPLSQEIDQADPLTQKWRYLSSVGMALFVLPFLCQRSLSKLRYVSLFILTVMVFTIVVGVSDVARFCTVSELPQSLQGQARVLGRIHEQAFQYPVVQRLGHLHAFLLQLGAFLLRARRDDEQE